MTEQLALFAQENPSQKPLPEGLRYSAEFIAPALERELISHVSALPLQPFQFGAFEGKRRVASFGFRYDYTLQRLQPAEPIPEWLLPLVEKVEADGGPSTQIASAPNTKSAWGSAGTATSGSSTGSSACRWGRRASFVFAGRPAKNGSAIRSRPRRARFT